MNFGKWIVVAFVLFAAFIGTLVVVCVRQDVSLVSGNYYQEELAYQNKLDQRNNTEKLAVLPEIKGQNGKVTLSFEGLDNISTGTLVLQRPANQRLDQRFEVSGAARQEFTLDAWQPGLYRASINWSMGGKDYFYEKLIVL